MDKQNVILKTQEVEPIVQQTHELEVIGRGGMVYEPCQIGDWWVMPADMYTGTIPAEAVKKWEDFKLYAQFTNTKVVGYLIADDMREVIFKREQEAAKQRELEEAHQKELEQKQHEIELERQALLQQQRNEELNRTVQEVAQVGGTVLVGIGMAVGAVISGIATAIGFALRLIFDPILIAVCQDGRWICVAEWWNETEA